MSDRNEFEEILKNSGIFTDDVDYNQILMVNSDGQYAFTRIRDYYYFWKSSRDMMKPIKLPELYMNADDPQTMAYNDACVECANAIVEAGYKVVAS